MRPTRNYLARMVLASAMTLVVVGAAQAPATESRTLTDADLSGKWLFSVTTDAGTGTPTVTMRQKGDSLTGHYSSQVLGERDFTGTVTGQKFSFAFTTDVQGTGITVTYTGIVETNDSLKDTVDLGGAASGTFTAKRMPT